MDDWLQVHGVADAEPFFKTFRKIRLIDETMLIRLIYTKIQLAS